MAVLSAHLLNAQVPAVPDPTGGGGGSGGGGTPVPPPPGPTFTYGYAVGVLFSTPNAGAEIQMAPTVSGAPDVGNAVIVGEVTPTYPMVFLPFPNDGVTRWFRARHVNRVDGDSKWTPWFSSVPYPVASGTGVPGGGGQTWAPLPKIPWPELYPDLGGTIDTAPGMQAHSVFLETFSTKFHVQRWLDHDQHGGASESYMVRATGGEAGDGVARCTHQNWREHPLNIPYDPSKLYRLRVRARQVTDPSSGGKSFYCGVSGIAADGVTYVNAQGNNLFTTQHYVAANGAVMGSSWQEFTGYFTGHGSTPTNTASDPENPSVLRTGVKYFRVMFNGNHDDGEGGVFEVDEIAIDIIPDTISVVPDSSTHRKTTIEEADAAWDRELDLMVNGLGQAGALHNWQGTDPDAGYAAAISVVAITDITDPPPHGGYVLQVDTTSQAATVLPDHLIPVDPALFEYLVDVQERYTLTPTGTQRFYAGFAPYGLDGIRIEPHHWYNGGSELRSQLNGAYDGVAAFCTIDADPSTMWGDAPDLASKSITNIATGNPTVITIGSHNLNAGMTVTIAGVTGNTPDINGNHVLTAVTATTISIGVNTTVAGTGGTVVGVADPTINEYIAGDVDAAAGGYSDLPNYAVGRVEAIDSSNNRVYIVSAYRAAFGAQADNSYIRRHRSGGNYMYAAATNEDASDGTSGGGWGRWTGLAGPDAASQLAPFADPDDGPNVNGGAADSDPMYWPPGTAYCKPVLLLNRDATGAMRTQFQVRLLRRPQDGDIGNVGANKLGKDDTSKTIPEDIAQSNGATVQRIAKGFQEGTARNGDAVTYLTAFQNIPAVKLIAASSQLAVHRPESIWGTLAQSTSDAGSTAYDDTASTFLVLRALNPTATGFDLRAVLLQKAATITPQSVDFGSSLLSTPFDVNSAENTSWVRATMSSNMPSRDDQYLISLEVKVTATGGTASKPAEGSVSAYVAIDSSPDGSVWTERWTGVVTNEICCGNTNVLTQQYKQIPVSVTGLANGDYFRVRYQDLVIVTDTGPGVVTGSATVEGWNNTIDTTVDGVEWFTATDNWAGATPDTDDFVGYQALEVTV